MAPNQADLIALTEPIASGKLIPVIDQTYPLFKVPGAIVYFQTGHAREKVVITV